MKKLLFAAALSLLAACGQDWSQSSSTPPTTCPDGTTLVGDVCQPPVQCPTGMELVNNTCVPPVSCPEGTSFVDSSCQPPVECPPGTELTCGVCVPPVECPANTVLDMGPPITCTPPFTCPEHQVLKDGKCYCEAGLVMDEGKCIPEPPPECKHNCHVCADGQEWSNKYNACVCKPGWGFGDDNHCHKKCACTGHEDKHHKNKKGECHD